MTHPPHTPDTTPDAPTIEDVRAALIAAAQERGPRLYTHWDRKLFAHIGYLLSRAFRREDPQQAVFSVYLQMIQEMIGRGYLRPTEGPWGLREQHMMGHCFLYLAVFCMDETHSPQQEIDLLVKAWNLCEGLQHAPTWIQQLTTSQQDECESLDQLESFLIELLDPVLQQIDESEWKGPFSLAQLDARELCETFLPGEMHFVAPAVLCVHDNHDPGNHIGVLLGKDGQHSFIGETGCLGEHLVCEAPPALEFAHNQVQINGEIVPLPWMGYRAYQAISDAGFLVLNTQHSQRLWIVESP